MKVDFLYPVPFAMACDILIVPVFIVASEQPFSASGRFNDKKWMVLVEETLETYVCVQDWF